MSFASVPDGEPDIAFPAFDAGEAAEILALLRGLLEAEPAARAAAARFLQASGADPGPALDWLAEGAGRLDAALSHAGIACDRILPCFRRAR